MSIILSLDMQERSSSNILNDTSDSENDGILGVASNSISVGGSSDDYPYSLQFSNIGDEINLTESIIIAEDDEATIRFISKRSNLAASHGILSSYAWSYITFEEARDRLHIVDEELNTLSIETNVDTRDYHIYCITFLSNGTCKLYVDGIFVGGFSGTRTHEVTINIIGDAISSNFLGYVAGLEIYDTVLTDNEILLNDGDIIVEESPNIINGSTVFIINASKISNRRVTVKKGIISDIDNQDGVFIGTDLSLQATGLYAGKFNDYTYYSKYRLV